MVVTPEPISASIGSEVLRRGGNAVDAAVAVAFTLAVTYPRAGSLGGGGLALLRLPTGEHVALDFRETAPRSLTPASFRDAGGDLRVERALTGGLAVAVPGVVAGALEAHRRWGSRPWPDLLAPAIRLAERGFPLSRRSAFHIAEREKDLGADPSARAVFFRDGKPLTEGERLVQRDLARVLRRIARQGLRGFYEGPTAADLVASIRSAGGVMDLEDLRSYRVRMRTPLIGTYRGHRIITFPPPSSGGVALLQILAMLEPYDIAASGPGSSLTVHRMVEAARRAFADRSRWLGDPDFVEVPLRRLLAPDYLRARFSTIRDDAATPSTSIGPGLADEGESEETTHFSITDDRGAAVAWTTTLNASFGAARVAARTGIVLNDEIDDFSLASDVPNQFGLLTGPANSVEPGKRPLSSMTPTVVEPKARGPRPLLVLGSPGGPTIINSVVEVIVNVIDHGMTLQEAVDAPRFHHQWAPDRLDHEKHAFSRDVALALEARGHALHERAAIGNVEAIGLDDDGFWLGAADPRGDGDAEGN